MSEKSWAITETEFNPQHMHDREAVFTLGNGYLGTRGSFEEGYPGDCPATFVHGVYDEVPIVYTELANCPDWLPMAVRIGEHRFRLDRGEILDYVRRLDLRRGLLTREVRWRSPAGHMVDLRFDRFASLADPHLLALRCQITPLDFEGPLQVQASLNLYATNEGFFHWQWLGQGEEAAGETLWLHARTRSSAIELASAARLTLSGPDGSEPPPVEASGCRGYPTLQATFQGRRGRTFTATKMVSLYTSRDPELRDGEVEPDVVEAARKKLAAAPDYAALRATHEKAWDDTWQDCDVVIEGDPQAQVAVRYNLFQLLVAAPREDDRVSIPAKTLSGFSYHGHIFWDTEIFIVPFFTYTQPALARNLLTYRHHMLPGARRKAERAGYEGATFPWESAASGDDVTPSLVFDPQGELARVWSAGDIQLHVSSDVAYAVWQYWQATGDDDWMRRRGAEIILETAVFWASRVEWNEARNWYEITDVIGPDEFHEHVDNDAFTNGMVRWHMEAALEVLAWLRRYDPARATELEHRLDLTPKRLRHWADVIGCLFVPYDPESGLFEQSAGFFELEDVDLADFEPRTQSMYDLLGHEGINRAQVLKQPDVLMLLYLLRERYDRETLRVNWRYYSPRTDHTYGSSLGPAIHAILACDVDRPDEAYAHFTRAALVDLESPRGDAAEGIHAASAGGVWQAVVFGFGGLRFGDQGPVVTPRLPAHWTRLRFHIQYRGRRYDFDLRPTAPS